MDRLRASHSNVLIRKCTRSNTRGVGGDDNSIKPQMSGRGSIPTEIDRHFVVDWEPYGIPARKNTEKDVVPALPNNAPLGLMQTCCTLES